MEEAIDPRRPSQRASFDPAAPPVAGACTPCLGRIMADRQRVLCAIRPDDAGRRLLRAAATLREGASTVLGVVCATPFELPFEGMACLFPNPLDLRARQIVQVQRQLDDLVRELGLDDAERFVTAGVPQQDIRGLARLWRPDLLLFSRSAGTGLRSRATCAADGYPQVAIDERGRVATRTVLERLWGGR